MISVHSPQSWAHFNMFGEYDFSNERPQDNTGVLPPKSVLVFGENGWGKSTLADLLRSESWAGTKGGGALRKPDNWEPPNR